MRVALLLLRRVVADVDLAADDRLDALLARVLVELHGARERPVVGEPDGGHLELRRARGESRNAAGPIENRELGVDVQVDEVGGQRTAHSRTPSGRSRMPGRTGSYSPAGNPCGGDPLEKTLLFLHILGVFLIVGGAGIATALGIKASKSRSHTIAELSGLSIVAERYVITPGAVLALVAGTFLVHKSGHTFGEFWLIAAYVLWITAIGLGWLVLGPHNSRLHKHAKELAASGVEVSDELQKEAAAPVGMIFGLVQNVILLAFIYLMVVRPGA